jgi:AcrR family transcriptional regulator
MVKKPTGNQRGRPKAFSTEDALYAAMCVFASKGYESASLSDLTKAMGINRTSMYATFGNKESLFRKSLDFYVTENVKQAEIFMASPTAKESMEKMLSFGVNMLTDPEGPGGCFITQGPLHGPDASAMTKEFFEYKRSTMLRLITKRFEKAKTDGELPENASPEDLAQFFYIVFQGMALQAQHGGTREQLMRAAHVAINQWPQKSAHTTRPKAELGD